MLNKIGTRYSIMIFVFFVVSITFTSGIHSYELYVEEGIAVNKSTISANWRISEVELTNHSPIVITSNSEFNSTNGVISGDGSEDHPYLIANWFIESSGSEDCISITNTFKHFRIENCTLTNASDSGLCGIKLTNVFYGSILNNVIVGNSQGIRLVSSSFNVIDNNTCNTEMHDVAIVLSSSNSNTLIRNYVTTSYFGFYLGDSSSNNLTSNTCIDNAFEGIFLVTDSNENIIHNNSCSGATRGIHIQGSQLNEITSNICYDNWLGVRISFSSDNTTVDKNTVIGNKDYGIYCDSSSFNTFTNNVVKDNGNGLEFISGTNNTVYYNTITNSEVIGINLQSCSDNNFTFNRLGNNTDFAFQLTNSITNNIYFNWIWFNGDNNTFGGDTTNNNISNNFYYPPSDFDSDDDGLTDEFELNFGTNPLSNDSDGDLFNDGDEFLWGSDPLDFMSHPLPPSVFIFPIQPFINNDGIIFDYTTSKGNVTIYLNDVANTTSQPSGSLISGLVDGYYNLTLAIIDPLGNIDTDSTFFTIDTLLPVVTISNPIKTFYDQDSVQLTYAITEGRIIIYIDGVANDTAHPSGALLSGFDDGIHTIIILAVDEAGNMGIATVAFLIDTTTSTLQTTDSLTNSPTDIAFSSIFAGLIGFFMIKRRRK